MRCVGIFFYRAVIILKILNGVESDEMTKNVAIIGGGASGLSSIRHCVSYGYKCQLFEQTDKIGGTWVYTNEVGFDSNGLPIHTSMYDELRTNLPKEIMNFPDYKFKEMKDSYITQKDVLHYLKSYAKHFKLQDYIKFKHRVTNVYPTHNKWILVVENLLTNKTFEAEFDVVLICSGHFSKPNVPNIPGTVLFKGQQLHSHDFRNSTPFKGKTVTILGAGPSGIDIAQIVSKDATKVFLSHRRKKISSEAIEFRENVKQVANFEKLTENSVILVDGTKVPTDVVIFCTGYKYDYPFLAPECDINVDNNWVKMLYKHVINIERPTMGFIGLTFQAVTFPMFDYQIRFFFNSLNKTFELPSKREMTEDTMLEMESKWNMGWPKKFAHRLGFNYQRRYLADLAKIAKLKPIPPVIMDIYDVSSGKFKRNRHFVILDEENYVES